MKFKISKLALDVCVSIISLVNFHRNEFLLFFHSEITKDGKSNIFHFMHSVKETTMEMSQTGIVKND